jgi:hypothetical protein
VCVRETAHSSLAIGSWRFAALSFKPQPKFSSERGDRPALRAQP